jgi:Tfp pilus assembly protein PilN
MQEINLLQNKVKDRTLQFERSTRLIVVLFTFVLIAEAAAFTGLYLLTSGTEKQTEQVKVQIGQIRTAMDSNNQELALAQGMQAQLKNVNTLIRNRVYWSAFLDELSRVTPVNVQYTNMSGAVTDNVFHIEGITDTYADVGRLLLSLSTNKDKFSNVKLHAVTPALTGTNFGYVFSIDVTAASSTFKKPSPQ